ncbi:2-(3-amino-3-carboxypropyl)histidine synthase subunit 1 [Anthonomus grandis grandis]|uniref:2-(3-amino-3-carboxypropyl)histidine synthase subunit 1 n=1 Tax=Anthonomus grandis grandis TaxID=2921223 RepID=UPI00216660CD|nr:2-(3-amino-3-carboxypropyl)histidine synthase subunit 1 [Anthonomus grandis grandis]
MSETAIVVKAKPQRKVFKATKVTKVPESLINDPLLKQACAPLPDNYNFEIPKTIWRIKELKAKMVALQMPEGLLLFATTLADIIKQFTGADAVIMGDVTYGACCIDDLTAKALGVELLVHYGHSCLVPIDQTSGIKVLYIFVDIKIDPLHFIETIKKNFPVDTKMALVSTIQFVTTLQAVLKLLNDMGFENVSIPQSRPLSPGEILGCTAPVLKCCDILIYLGDGDFHLDAAMIANPRVKAYKYDPYSKRFTLEHFSHAAMESARKTCIEKAESAGTFGVIMGTLGRQGSAKVVEHLRERLEQKGRQAVVILLSEIFPDKVKLFNKIEGFVQIACPRLSIDWGLSFSQPLLTPYELAVLLGDARWHKENESYPMDFYANASLGPWTPNHKPGEVSVKNCCGKCP